METNNLSHHLASIIPVAGQPLDFNMPWADALMPVHQDYHAVERAVHTAAMAGSNTIWVVLYRESQPIIKKKLSSWIYDPTHVWVKPYAYLNKREIPIYYVSINPKDRKRRDSLSWSILYGAKAASYVSLKISRWVVPKRFLVVSPYGVVSENTIKDSRVDLKRTEKVRYTFNGKSFLDNEHIPFTFDAEDYKLCKEHFRNNYMLNGSNATISQVFEPLAGNNYKNINLEWYHNIGSWDGYSQFLGSEQNKECARPKYMVKHKWRGLVSDK